MTDNELRNMSTAELLRYVDRSDPTIAELAGRLDEFMSALEEAWAIILKLDRPKQ